MSKIALGCLIIIFLSILIENLSYAQLYVANEPYIKDRIVTAVPFLLITADAKSAGMGDSGVATPPDENAVAVNASKLAFLRSKAGFSFSYTPWLSNLSKEMKLTYLSGYFRLSDKYVFGSSIKYFSLGNVDFTDGNQQSLGTMNPGEYAVEGCVARKFGHDFSLATAIKYINSNLYVIPNYGGVQIQKRQSVAVDVSGFFKKTINLFNAAPELGIGLCILNIGPRMNYTGNSDLDFFLPTNFKIGTSLSFLSDDYSRLTVASDLNKLLVPSPKIANDNYHRNSLASSILSSFSDAQGGFKEELREIGVSTGLEYSYAEKFDVRAGYTYQDRAKGDNRYLTVGMGMRYKTLKIDLSYLTGKNNHLAFSNTLRFTIGFDFNKTN